MQEIASLQVLFVENEAILRFSSFIILMLVLLGLEFVMPRRLPDAAHGHRRIHNILLLLVNILAIRLLVPLALFDVAMTAAEHKVGLFNLIQLPLWLNVVLTLIVFDLLIYIQHVVTHKVHFLWLIHRVHHTDLEVDVTTGIRFHPIEILLSLLYKMLAVLLIGPVAFAIILYEILLNAAALFTHSNIMLNNRVDRGLRTVFVTPDMHRIHHSTIKQETDSNFGNILSCWDKLFKTYQAVPEAGYDKMQIGLDEFREPASGKLTQLLKLPFLTAGKL